MTHVMNAACPDSDGTTVSVSSRTTAQRVRRLKNFAQRNTFISATAHDVKNHTISVQEAKDRLKACKLKLATAVAAMKRARR